MTVTAPIRWVEDMLPLFLKFAGRIRIATKERGLLTLSADNLTSTQQYLLAEIFTGLDAGLHDFLICKARQLQVSSILWTLTLWWLQKFEAMQGLYVTDDGGNTEVHRRIIMEMYGTLPPKYSRGPVDVNNRTLLEWKDQPGWHASRLMWEHGNADQGGQLGRSRGINFGQFEELDGWSDDPSSLVLGTDHPHRLYLWVGTGQGYKLLYSMWEQAAHSLTRKRIFIGWWRLSTNRIIPDDKPLLWRAYGRPSATPEEREWITETRRLFGHEVTQEELAWWRMTMAESPNIKGHQAKMLQEHPWFPEQSFQASGSQFLSAGTMLRMHQAQGRAPEPTGYVYDWGGTFDARLETDEDGKLVDRTLVEARLEDADLTIWEEPEPAGLYVVAGDPAYGASAKGDAFAITVWRCWQDRLVQVAEYRTPIGTVYQYAWTLVHLSGCYRRWLIYEISGPGVVVKQEIDRMKNLGYGLAQRGGRLQGVIAGIQEYLYFRPDSLTATPAWQWKTSSERRESVMESLRDSCERGAMVIRSRRLWNEIGSLRREGMRIEPGGVAHDDLAITAALANEYWLSTIVEEIQSYVPKKDATPTAAIDPTRRAVSSFLARIGKDDTKEPRRLYGVRGPAPGR